MGFHFLTATHLSVCVCLRGLLVERMIVYFNSNWGELLGLLVACRSEQCRREDLRVDSDRKIVFVVLISEESLDA